MDLLISIIGNSPGIRVDCTLPVGRLLCQSPRHHFLVRCGPLSSHSHFLDEVIVSPLSGCSRCVKVCGSFFSRAAAEASILTR